MRKYKFYYKDYKEHFEICDDENIIEKYEANYGESLFSLFCLNQETLDSYLSIISYYISLADTFYKRRQLNENTSNEFPIFSFDDNHIFRFFWDSFLQYTKNELDVAPNKNTWFNYSISKNNLTYTSNEFCNNISYAKDFFYSAICSKSLSLDYTNTFSNPLTIGYEKIDGKNTEVLYPKHINDIIQYYIILTLRLIEHSNLCIIKCKRCCRLFANFKSGRNVLYCNYKNESNYTCREEMALSFKDRERTDTQIEADKIYRKYYDYQRRKLKKHIISNKEFKSWSAKTRLIRNKCKENIISISEFIIWIESNKDNY